MYDQELGLSRIRVKQCLYVVAFPDNVLVFRKEFILILLENIPTCDSHYPVMLNMHGFSF